jgi:hypothetical protein
MIMSRRRRREVAPHQGRRGVAAVMLRVTPTPATCPTCGCSSNSRTKCGSACWPLESVFTTKSPRFCNPPPATPAPHDRHRSCCRLHELAAASIAHDTRITRLQGSRSAPARAKAILSMPGFFLARRGPIRKIQFATNRAQGATPTFGGEEAGRSCEGQ